jgi:hypothetical protein
VQAVNTVLEAFRPKGNVSAKPVGDFAHLPVASYDTIGQAFAQDFLQQLKKPDDKRTDAETVRAARERLAEMLSRMRAKS